MRFKYLFIFAVSLLAITTSCGGGPGERIKEIEATKATPSPTPGERLISGVFNVTGADTGGIDEYNGVLTIANEGDVYSFRWTTNRGTRVGTGIQMGNATAASYSSTGAGKGCGVVLYKIAPDGSLDGRIARWGEDTFTTENAVRIEGTGFTGKYSVTGKDHPGTLSIKKDGSGYDFQWETDKPQVAFGIWKGSVAAASFGGRQCSFALYDIQSNGNLEGDWAARVPLHSEKKPQSDSRSGYLITTSDLIEFAI